MTALLLVSAWKVLVGIGVVLIISEIFVPGFVMLPAGIGFLLAAIVGAFTNQWIPLLAALAASELVVFWFFKNVLKSYHGKTKAYTNAEGMIGAECRVTEAIVSGGTGYVKLYGDLWMAKSTTGEALEKDLRVVIVKTEGNKVYVERMV